VGSGFGVWVRVLIHPPDSGLGDQCVQRAAGHFDPEWSSNLQGYLAHKKQRRPSTPPREEVIDYTKGFELVADPDVHGRGRHSAARRGRWG